jgi:hypothetical protein
LRIESSGTKISAVLLTTLVKEVLDYHKIHLGNLSNKEVHREWGQAEWSQALQEVLL